jgi:hypothetical protein
VDEGSGLGRRHELDQRLRGLAARQIAAQLMARGISTPNGAKWHAQTVIRVMNRTDMAGNVSNSSLC